MSYTLTLGTSAIEYTLDPVGSNVKRIISKDSIVDFTVKNHILNVWCKDDISLIVPLTTLSNQPTWSTGNLAGDQAAIADIETWQATGGGGGGGGGDASAANQVIGNNSLSVIAANALISANGTNSSVTPLAANGVFTGASEDISQYGFISIAVISNVASATNGLSFQGSADGTNWDFLDAYTVPAATGKVYSIARNFKFFRVVFTNGATIQASFRLQTIYTKYGIPPSSIKMQDGRSNDNDVQEVAAYANLFNGTSWDRALKGQQTMANSQAVALASDQSALTANTGTVNMVFDLSAILTGPLLAGGIMSTGFFDVSQYQTISIMTSSDVDSAVNGLEVHFNTFAGVTGYNKTFTSLALAVGTQREFIVPVTAQFVRIRYINGAVDQTRFAFNILLHKTQIQPSIKPQDGLTNETSVPLSFPMIWDPINSVWNRQQIQDLSVTGQSTQTAVVNNILTVASGSAAIDLIGYRSFAVQVVSTGTGGTFIFEGSNDNVNFQAIPVFNQALAVPVPIVTAITATSSQFIYVGGSEFRFIRLRIATTITGGNIQAFSKFSQVPISVTQMIVAQGTAANLNATISSITTSIVPGTAATNAGKARNAAAGATDTGSMMLALRNDALTTFGTTANYTTPTADKYGNLITKDQQRHKATYRCTFLLPIYDATKTDLVQIIGSASKTVSITNIKFGGTAGTAGTVVYLLQKRSTANSAGTSTAQTLVPLDSGSAAATTVVSLYTANPTPGTSIGNVEILPVYLPTTITQGAITEAKFAERGQSLVLNGAAQALAIVNSGGAVSTSSVTVTIEFTEE